MSRVEFVDDDGDSGYAEPYDGSDPRYLGYVRTQEQGVHLTEADLRALRAWIDERLGEPVKDEPVVDVKGEVTKTPTGALDWSTFGYWHVPEPRLLFGVPENVVQELVEAALTSATKRLDGR